MVDYLIAGVTAAVIAITVYITSNTSSYKARKARARLPPGPKQNLLLGNVFNFPRDHWYETFTAWQKEFGDLVFVNLNIAGVTMLIVNSLEVAEELMVRRSKTYSGRPHTTLINDLMYNSWSVVMQPDEPLLHEQRRILHKSVGPSTGPQYDHIVREQLGLFLPILPGKTVDPFEVVTSAIGVIITKLSYGDKFDREHGEELRNISLEDIELVAAVFTKFWAVDLLPFLRHIPTWFPGAEFKRIGAHAMSMAKHLRFEPIGHIEKAMAEGTADESLMTALLQDQSINREAVRDALATMLSVGVDTTATTITTLFYFMVLYPECQKLVQKELDELAGSGGVPSFAEIQNLPYLNAVWKESLRKAPVPLGIPHVASEEDIWNGFYIPKGCIIQCNIGFMMKDPRIWGDESSLFKPERFLGPSAKDLPDPTSLAFGFGRRICPGRFFANRLALQFAAATLSSFNILPEQGKSLSEADVVFQGSVQRPLHFRCRFESRRVD